MKEYSLKLFISGDSLYGQNARGNLQRLCDEMFDDNYELLIIDVIAEPDKAEAEKILATPTLICLHHGNSRRVIGDLSDLQMVATVLGIIPKKTIDDHGV